MTEPDGQRPLQAFLYADPAAHSLSPRMHRAAFAHAGLRGEYEARRVPPADLPAALAALRRPGVLGANLSLPHKEAALAHVDDLTPAAQAVGAVNTVIHREGRLRGENTDAPGLWQALADAGYRPAPGAVVVLGAGGAARAAVYAALALGGQDVWVVNRTPERAQTLAQSMAQSMAQSLGSSRPGPGAGPTVTAAPAEAVPWARAALVVNASSAGLNAPEQTPLPGFDFGRLAGALVYDMVYRPAETRLLREARAAGLRAENGLGMLAHQARLAFLAWTGRDVPVDVFLGALADEDDAPLDPFPAKPPGGGR